MDKIRDNKIFFGSKYYNKKIFIVKKCDSKPVCKYCVFSAVHNPGYDNYGSCVRRKSIYLDKLIGCVPGYVFKEVTGGL